MAGAVGNLCLTHVGKINSLQKVLLLIFNNEQNFTAFESTRVGQWSFNLTLSPPSSHSLPLPGLEPPRSSPVLWW